MAQPDVVTPSTSGPRDSAIRRFVDERRSLPGRSTNGGQLAFIWASRL
jgi:hypothetical protein